MREFRILIKAEEDSIVIEGFAEDQAVQRIYKDFCQNAKIQRVSYIYPCNRLKRIIFLLGRAISKHIIGKFISKTLAERINNYLRNFSKCWKIEILIELVNVTPKELAELREEIDTLLESHKMVDVEYCFEELNENRYRILVCNRFYDRKYAGEVEHILLYPILAKLNKNKIRIKRALY